jgi:hypothetical protein
VPARLRVQAAVDTLQPCLTCHAWSSSLTEYTAFPLHANSIEEQTISQDVAALPPAEILRVQVDTELLDMGRRLLAAPETEAVRYESAAAAYLRVYERTRSAQDQDTLMGALVALEQLEHLLRDLEHQSNPARLDQTSKPGATLLTRSVQQAPPPAPSALFHRLEVGLYPPILPLCLEQDNGWLASIFVFDAHRRGPPGKVT